MLAIGSCSRLLRRAVAALARLMPLSSPVACTALSVLFLSSAFCLVAETETVAGAIPPLADAMEGLAGGWSFLRGATWATVGVAGLCALIFQARCLQICFPQALEPDFSGPARIRRGRHGFAVAGMPVGYDDMRTSVLVTGVTGSAKTAGVLLPALAQLLKTYREETRDEFSPSEFQKIGAFIPEVKGDLVDACIYLAHEAGRCVSRDFAIITPCCRIPVVRFRDERGRFWFVSGRGGAGGSDAGELLPRVNFPQEHPRAGRPVTELVLESPSDCAAVLPRMRGVRLNVERQRPRFVGWRWRGSRLARVSHTTGRDRTEPLADGCGQPVWADPPRELSVDGVTYVDNGLHYNLVDPRLPAAEAAERITRLVAMARGGSGHGENDYFYDQGRKLISACISLHRAVESSACTAADVVRLATQEARLRCALSALADRIARLRREASAAGPEERENLERHEIGPLVDLEAFFRDEWERMLADGKTANVIKSVISAAFDVFLQDPSLAETFCRPSTFSFEDIVQSGKIIGFVPGERYERLGRLLGTACKLDFQSTMLARTSRADLNQARLALYFADECHKYLVSGSSTAGDPYFMNLSRSNNVVNLCATQSYAWIVEVIGREAAEVYISAFGVQFWLQQTDPETCRRAAEICGTVSREIVCAEHSLNFSGLLEALGSGRPVAVRHQVRTEEKKRFGAEDFAHLNVGDIVAYNKGRKGRTAKVSKGRAAFHPCTRKPDGPAAVRERVREYYRELLENLTHERGESRRWDCGAGGGPGGAAAADCHG